MKLFIAQKDGDGTGGSAFLLYQEDGSFFPCCQAASIHHGIGQPAVLDLSLVVDGQSIVFGTPKLEDYYFPINTAPSDRAILAYSMERKLWEKCERQLRPSTTSGLDYIYCIDNSSKRNLYEYACWRDLPSPPPQSFIDAKQAERPKEE
jgi:hypothetical protein